jgi:hypothetical protein
MQQSQRQMKLPADSIIAREKLTQYLLVRQSRGDKSGYLELAGYTQDNPDQLLRDLREQVLPQEATPLEHNFYGQFYEIHTTLTGPSGRRLGVRTIWMTEHLSGRTKFITLIPDQIADDES